MSQEGNRISSSVSFLETFPTSKEPINSAVKATQQSTTAESFPVPEPPTFSENFGVPTEEEGRVKRHAENELSFIEKARIQGHIYELGFKVGFVMSAIYYYTDTILRLLKKNKATEEIQLLSANEDVYKEVCKTLSIWLNKFLELCGSSNAHVDEKKLTKEDANGTGMSFALLARMMLSLSEQKSAEDANSEENEKFFERLLGILERLRDEDVISQIKENSKIRESYVRYLKELHSVSKVFVHNSSLSFLLQESDEGNKETRYGSSYSNKLESKDEKRKKIDDFFNPILEKFFLTSESLVWNKGETYNKTNIFQKLNDDLNFLRGVYLALFGIYDGGLHFFDVVEHDKRLCMEKLFEEADGLIGDNIEPEVVLVTPEVFGLFGEKGSAGEYYNADLIFVTKTYIELGSKLFEKKVVHVYEIKSYGAAKYLSLIISNRESFPIPHRVSGYNVSITGSEVSLQKNLERFLAFGERVRATNKFVGMEVRNLFQCLSYFASMLEHVSERDECEELAGVRWGVIYSFSDSQFYSNRLSYRELRNMKDELENFSQKFRQLYIAMKKIAAQSVEGEGRITEREDSPYDVLSLLEVLEQDVEEHEKRVLNKIEKLKEISCAIKRDQNYVLKNEKLNTINFSGERNIKNVRDSVKCAVENFLTSDRGPYGKCLTLLHSTGTGKTTSVREAFLRSEEKIVYFYFAPRIEISFQEFKKFRQELCSREYRFLQPLSNGIFMPGLYCKPEGKEPFSFGSLMLLSGVSSPFIFPRAVSFFVLPELLEKLKNNKRFIEDKEEIQKLLEKEFEKTGKAFYSSFKERGSRIKPPSDDDTVGKLNMLNRFFRDGLKCFKEALRSENTSEVEKIPFLPDKIVFLTTTQSLTQTSRNVNLKEIHSTVSHLKKIVDHIINGENGEDYRVMFVIDEITGSNNGFFVLETVIQEVFSEYGDRSTLLVFDANLHSLLPFKESFLDYVKTRSVPSAFRFSSVNEEQNGYKLGEGKFEVGFSNGLKVPFEVRTGFTFPAKSLTLGFTIAYEVFESFVRRFKTGDSKKEKKKGKYDFSVFDEKNYRKLLEKNIKTAAKLIEDISKELDNKDKFVPEVKGKKRKGVFGVFCQDKTFVTNFAKQFEDKKCMVLTAHHRAGSVTEAIEKGYNIIAFTSSGSRGIDIRNVYRLFVVIDHYFNVENDAAEIIQACARIRSGKQDPEIDKFLMFVFMPSINFLSFSEEDYEYLAEEDLNTIKRDMIEKFRENGGTEEEVAEFEKDFEESRNKILELLKVKRVFQNLEKDIELTEKFMQMYIKILDSFYRPEAGKEIVVPVPGQSRPVFRPEHLSSQSEFFEYIESIKNCPQITDIISRKVEAEISEKFGTETVVDEWEIEKERRNLFKKYWEQLDWAVGCVSKFLSTNELVEHTVTVEREKFIKENRKEKVVLPFITSVAQVNYMLSNKINEFRKELVRERKIIEILMPLIEEYDREGFNRLKRKMGEFFNLYSKWSMRRDDVWNSVLALSMYVNDNKTFRLLEWIEKLSDDQTPFPALIYVPLLVLNYEILAFCRNIDRQVPVRVAQNCVYYPGRVTRFELDHLFNDRRRPYRSRVDLLEQDPRASKLPVFLLKSEIPTSLLTGLYNKVSVDLLSTEEREEQEGTQS